MTIATYECRVILLIAILGMCWGSALHLSVETEVLDETQPRWRSSVVEKQSCPTWYRETKHNGVTRCVCGARLENNVRCDDATQETLILEGFCMSHDDAVNDTVIGRCPFNYHYPDAQVFYVTLPNDTSELNSFMCKWFESNWHVLQPVSARSRTCCSLLQKRVCRMP